MMRAPSDSADGERGRGREIRSWCLYDWASSAFVTTVTAALFPPFFRSLATASGVANATATAYWGYTNSIAVLLVALVAPVLGALADHVGGLKRFVAAFAVPGMLATAAFALLGNSSWRAAAALFVAAAVGFEGANVFYEALLPHVARGADIDRISARGYALGYVGGGCLLVVNALWVMKPGLFGLPGTGTAVRLSFLAVAVWWGAFSVPFFRHVSEPPGARRRVAVAAEPPAIAAACTRLRGTFRELGRYRQLVVFLIAFWIYNDGIGTIIRMATAYGDEIGLRLTDMIAALILTQFVGIPCALLFGRLATRIGAKRAIQVALGVYLLISIGGYFMRTAAHFYALAIAVGTAQGGAQALSRSLFGAMVPRHKSAEFFGFYTTSSRFAGVAGPLVFGAVSALTGASRLSVAALAVFFLAGGLLLARVDVEAGRRAARAAEQDTGIEGTEVTHEQDA
jgi:UMF1 family MFS transporter